MDPVTEFELKIAAFFGAPYAVATDSCTSGVELCLRLHNHKSMRCPKRTYLSIPMLANKLGLNLYWDEENDNWENYYDVAASHSGVIMDAAVHWKAGGYNVNTGMDVFMCLSFQHQKHLSLGRGGMILCPNKESSLQLKKMSYDGRLPNIPWREQDVDIIGYHYYMTPETAQLGLDKLDAAIATPPRQWVYTDWPLLTEMKVFKK